MSKVEIFEPGVGGSFVDQDLLRVSAMITVLEAEGKKIIRYNLSNHAQAFIDNDQVNTAFEKDGNEALPITVVDGEIKQVGSYPSNAELAAWTGMSREELISMVIKARDAANDGGGCCGDKKSGGCC